MRSYGTAVYAGGGWTGTHVPLPTAPRPNGRRPEREPVIVLQPLSRAEERALERRSARMESSPSLRPVTDRETADYIRMYRDGHSLKAIGKKHGRHARTVRHHLSWLGVEIRQSNNMTGRKRDTTSADEQARIVSLYESGLSMRQVEHETNRSHATVQRVLRAAGVDRRSAGGVAIQWTAEQLEEMAADYLEAGCNAAAVARKWGVNRHTIARALKVGRHAPKGDQ